MPSPRWRRYLRFWKHDVAADIDDELRFHFDQRVAEYETAGMSADEARGAADSQFGNVLEIRSELLATVELLDGVTPWYGWSHCAPICAQPFGRWRGNLHSRRR